MMRLTKNGLIREVESLDAAIPYIQQGYELAELDQGDVEEPLLTASEMRREAARLTVEQLTEQCKALEIEIPTSAKKADLIELLVANTIGAAEG